MGFQNKVVWITGASSGIGEHLAYALAKEGSKLILSSRKRPELERVQQNLPVGTESFVLPLDVAAFDTVPGIAQQAIECFGRLDILINNAGISQRALAKDTALSVDQRIMDVNYIGTVAVTKAVLPQLLKQQSGQIVAISSVMGKIGTPMRTAYAASKHALHGFFDCLRAEHHRDNLIVTVICPGYVRTNVSINALKGDGSKNATMNEDTKEGLSPEGFAQKALRAIATEKQEAYIGGKEVVAIHLRRFFPRLLSRIVRNRVPR